MSWLSTTVLPFLSTIWTSRSTVTLLSTSCIVFRDEEMSSAEEEGGGGGGGEVGRFSILVLTRETSFFGVSFFICLEN